MSHTHEEGQSSYYLEQLCTVTLCGALSGVAVMMWSRDSLFFLIDRFQWFVFFGGITLLVLVVIRAMSVWNSAGQKTVVHDHAHEPGHDCAAHDHAGHDCEAHEHAHEHEHPHEHGPTDGPGHDHAWNPWRYAVLLLPIVLYFMNLPNQGFVGERRFRGGDLGNVVQETVKNYSPDTGIIVLDFKELDRAKFFPEARAFFSGRIGKIMGQFAPYNQDRFFSLVRFKIRGCCGTDAVPLNVIIEAPESLRDFQEAQWVEVEGQIQFGKRENRDEYVPLMKVASMDKIKKIPPDKIPPLKDYFLRW